MSQISVDVEFKTRVSAQDLLDLARPSPGWHVSVFLPLEGKGRAQARRSRILQGLWEKAKEELAARGVDGRESERLLMPLDAIRQENGVEEFHANGLAIYASDETVKCILLPDSPEASVEVDRFFRLEPLGHALSATGGFYLLGIDVHSVGLWKGDALAMESVALDNLETDIKNALHFEDSDPQSQFRTNSGSPSRNKSKGQGSSFYGVGGSKDVRKSEFLAFFRKIDHGIAEKISEKDVPLILVGVEYLLNLYREVNTHSHLSPLQIHGNPRVLEQTSDLHKRAFALAMKSVDEETELALRIFRENIAESRTASGFTDVIPLAFYRKITHLFIRKGSRQWGAFFPDEGRTEIFEAFRSGSVDLVNLACSHTLHGHGKVYVLNADEMPGKSDIAALCRT